MRVNVLGKKGKITNYLKQLKNLNYVLKVEVGRTLNNVKDDYPHLIKEIRGVGLLIGIQLYKDQNNFIKKLQDNNLLTMRAAENVVRILPPLNVKKQEIDLAIKIIRKVCNRIN